MESTVLSVKQKDNYLHMKTSTTLENHNNFNAFVLVFHENLTMLVNWALYNGFLYSQLSLF